MDHSAHAVCVRVQCAALRKAGLIFAVALGLVFASIAGPRDALAAQPSRKFVGRSLGEVLDSLRGQGLTFIYNTRLVPDRLRVEQEPRARAGFALAAEILAAHGLGVSQAAPGVYAVTASPREKAVHAPLIARDAADRVEEVIVQTSRYTLRAEPGASKAYFTQEDIANMPRLGDETLRAVQRLPGVASSGLASLGAIRGGGTNETSIVLDGLRLYEPFHLKNFLSPISLLDSRVIGSMNVYSGGFPVTHGDRMSSIIEASSVGPDELNSVRPRYFEAGVSLFHASVLASSTFADARGHALLSARRSNIGDFAQYSENDFGEPQYADGFAKLSYEISDATRASLHVLASSDRILAIKDAGRQRANAEYKNAYVWGALEHDWSDAVMSRVILSYTRVGNEHRSTVDDPGVRSGFVTDERTFYVVGMRAEHEFPALGVDHRLGVEVRRLSAQYDYESDVSFGAGYPFPASPAFRLRRRAAPTPHGFESSAWWDARRKLSRRWTLQAGLRIDTQTYDGSGDAEQLAPRLNVLYELSDATRLRASFGRFYQSQGINELQVEDGVDRFYPAQHADHVIASIDHRLAPGLDLRVEAYRKYYRKINPRFENRFDPLVFSPELQLDRLRIDPNNARAQGVELTLRWRSQGAWRGWLSYTWSKAEDRIEGRSVARSWDQPHAIDLGVTWASGPWSATLIDSFHTGWPTTAVTLAPVAGGGVEPVIGERNAMRLGYYNSLDFRVTRTFALPRGVLDVFIEANNALSHKNPCCVEYTASSNADGSVTLTRDVDDWLPLTPSIGVLWRY